MRKHKASNYEFSAMVATYALGMICVATLFMMFVLVMELTCWNLW